MSAILYKIHHEKAPTAAHCRRFDQFKCKFYAPISSVNSENDGSALWLKACASSIFLAPCWGVFCKRHNKLVAESACTNPSSYPLRRPARRRCRQQRRFGTSRRHQQGISGNHLRASALNDGMNKASREVIDRDTTTMGLRTIAFDATTSFSINGHPTKLNGVCLYGDLGCLGTAINEDACIGSCV